MQVQHNLSIPLEREIVRASAAINTPDALEAGEESIALCTGCPADAKLAKTSICLLVSIQSARPFSFSPSSIRIASQRNNAQDCRFSVVARIPTKDVHRETSDAKTENTAYIVFALSINRIVRSISHCDSHCIHRSLLLSRSRRRLTM
ncbi:hypothetical protein PsYK624_019060 [Phanerochaete sordida]|uniref:Uncharacterized protein n=1 Tax=Phanerochaete sordida TaxID=48140 RepID=A0A9P3L9K7_9APHY|nr:hypothetical protein PsYK624_019060 [Phanerochaete sordida]